MNRVDPGLGAGLWRQAATALDYLHDRSDTDEARRNERARCASRIWAAALHRGLADADCFSPINPTDLVIDDSALSADETAERIVAHFSLLE